MKGLLIKDFKLMKRQSHFYMLVLAVAVGVAIFAKQSTFIIGYLAFVGSQFVFSSISYDGYDNGNPFLFSLPFTRKAYVAEKYVLGLILGVASLVVAGIIVLVSSVAKGTATVTEIFIICLSVLPLTAILISFTLPFQLKYGSERGTLVITVAMALLLVVFIAISKALSALGILDKVMSMNMAVLIMAGIAVAGAVLFISYKISLSIVRKKEF